MLSSVFGRPHVLQMDPGGIHLRQTSLPILLTRWMQDDDDGPTCQSYSLGRLHPLILMGFFMEPHHQTHFSECTISHLAFISSSEYTMQSPIRSTTKDTLNRRHIYRDNNYQRYEHLSLK